MNKQRVCIFAINYIQLCHMHFAHAARAIASRVRVFFFNCIEKPFFRKAPFFRAAKARLFQKRRASNSKNSSRGVNFALGQLQVVQSRTRKPAHLPLFMHCWYIQQETSIVLFSHSFLTRGIIKPIAFCL